MNKSETWIKLKESGIVKGELPSGSWDLNRLDFFESYLPEVDLSNASMKEAYCNQVEFTGGNLSNVDLSDAQLYYAFCTKVDFSNASLIRANLNNTDLDYSNFHKADLTEANLGDAILDNCDLSDANLTGAYLQGASLKGANLSGTLFRKADLSGVNLDDTDFSVAELTDAILNKKTDAQIQFENHPDKGKHVRVIGNRTWVEPYIGKTGVLQGYSQSINGHEILLDSGEVLSLYPEEFEFI